MFFKKYIKKIICFIVFLIAMQISVTTYGFVKDDYKAESSSSFDVLIHDWIQTPSSKILEDLQAMGYDGTSLPLPKEIKLKTKLIITYSKNGKYKISLSGSNTDIAKVGKSTLSRKILEEWFGLDKNVKDSDLVKGYSWDANMIVVGMGETVEPEVKVIEYPIMLKALYTGDDLNKIDNVQTDGTPNNANMTDTMDKTIDVATKVAAWAAEFLENPGGKMTTVIMDGLLFLADGIQYWASSFQTLGDHTARDFTITYTYDDLQKDAEGEDIKKDKIKNSEEAIGNRDKYTKVSGYKEKETESWQKEINLDKQTEDAYTKETEIPVMVGDVYNVIVNHIDFFDINFFTGNKDKKADGKTAKHAKDSTWMVLRNFVTSVIHIVIYISATTLILSLIYNGVKIVGHSLDNPSARAEYKKGLERFWKSLLMLVGSVIIMGLCIFGAKTFYEDIESNDSYELPIRVNVENAEYSFSTTFTGYVRYMAGIEDIDQALKKTVYTMGYIVLAIINFIAMLGMAISVFALFGLSMLGPILAALYVFDKQGPISYASWVELYVGFSIIPIFVMSIGYKLVLSTVG